MEAQRLREKLDVLQRDKGDHALQLTRVTAGAPKQVLDQVLSVLQRWVARRWRCSPALPGLRLCGRLRGMLRERYLIRDAVRRLNVQVKPDGICSGGVRLSVGGAAADLAVAARRARKEAVAQIQVPDHENEPVAARLIWRGARLCSAKRAAPRDAACARPSVDQGLPRRWLQCV